MALSPCRECGKDVSTEAATCPHCGVPNPTGGASPPPAPPAPANVPFGQQDIGTAKGCAIGCLAFILIIVVVGMCSGGSGSDTASPTTTDGDPGQAAYTACTNAVKGQLRAPSTADFPWFDYRWGRNDDGSYLITGHVDAQNGFGAQIRSPWMCTVRGSGSTWTVQEAMLIE